MGVEGSFVGGLRTVDGKSIPIRLNIVCLKPDRIVSSMALVSSFPPGADAVVTFGFTAIDGDEIILSEYSVLPDDREDAPARTTGGYMRFPISSLLGHEPTGHYTGGTAHRLLSFETKRTQEFPVITGAMSQPVPKSWMRGHWNIEKSTSGPLDLTIDVLMDAPVFAALVVTGERVVRLIDGPRWNDRGVFYSSNPTQDFEDDAPSLFHIRGRVLNDKTLEVYWVSPHAGLVGPLRAKKSSGF